MKEPLRMMQLFFLAAGAIACGGEIRFGVRGGVPFTSYFETRRTGSGEYWAATRRYTVGLSAEWRGAGGSGLELDVLYRRMGYVGIVSVSGGGAVTKSSFDAKGNSWDFSLLAKHRFGRSVRPYIAGGGVVRYIGPIRARGERIEQDLARRTTAREPIDTAEPSDLRKRIYPGLAVAAGVEFGRGRPRLLPELRYTRWTANISGPGGALRFNPNQLEFLLGVLF